MCEMKPGSWRNFYCRVTQNSVTIKISSFFGSQVDLKIILTLSTTKALMTSQSQNELSVHFSHFTSGKHGFHWIWGALFVLFYLFICFGNLYSIYEQKQTYVTYNHCLKFHLLCSIWYNFIFINGEVVFIEHIYYNLFILSNHLL